MRKIAFKFFGSRHNSWEGQDFADSIATMLDGSSRYQVVEDAEDADWVALVESNIFKTRDYITEILADPIIQKHADKCFSINYEDDALGILPGIYAGLPRKRFEPGRHVASCYLKPANEDDLKRAEWLESNSGIEPKHTVSFRGAMSHPARKQLLAMSPKLKHLGPITHVDRWFNHSDEEKTSYWQEILDSKFVLCPRGISPVSIRLFEVMELGRVPIIISDEWVAPKGPNWDACSIRVAEKDIAMIHEVVAQYEANWQCLAQNAQREWNEHFFHRSKLENALNEMEKSLSKHLMSYEVLQQYRKWQRRWALGWTLPQRLIRKLVKTNNLLAG